MMRNGHILLLYLFVVASTASSQEVLIPFDTLKRIDRIDEGTFSASRFDICM
ncbi:MAG: hypothetical protein NTV54_10705 [Ignavibacteriales bacterium]|nr:hypothetical protein [Ignavibacteriales bacterium]